MSLTLEQRLRTGHVRRWHIVAVAKEQTVADHSHRVGILVDHILNLFGHDDYASGVRLNAMEWARVHDHAEVMTGDMPSNAKQLYLEQLDCIDVVHDIESKFLTPVQYDLMQSVSLGGDCPLAGVIVKVADMLEACNYLLVFGCGAHAERVRDDLFNRLMAYIAKHLLAERQTENYPDLVQIEDLVGMCAELGKPNYQSKDTTGRRE